MTQTMPLRMRRSLTRGMPRGLFGSIGLMVAYSHDPRSEFSQRKLSAARCFAHRHLVF
jgi:hypothetical protein